MGGRIGKRKKLQLQDDYKDIQDSMMISIKCILPLTRGGATRRSMAVVVYISIYSHIWVYLLVGRVRCDGRSLAIVTYGLCIWSTKAQARTQLVLWRGCQRIAKWWIDGWIFFRVFSGSWNLQHNGDIWCTTCRCQCCLLWLCLTHPNVISQASNAWACPPIHPFFLGPRSSATSC